MKIGTLKVILVTAAVVGIGQIDMMRGGQDSDSDGQKFRREMLPKVGDRITFVGTVVPSKFGVRITPDRWAGIEVEAKSTNQIDLAKLNKIDRMQGYTLRVEGVLHHVSKQDGPILHGVQTSGIPDHFFFDVAEVSFSELKPGQHEQQTTK